MRDVGHELTAKLVLPLEPRDHRVERVRDRSQERRTGLAHTDGQVARARAIGGGNDIAQRPADSPHPSREQDDEHHAEENQRESRDCRSAGAMRLASIEKQGDHVRRAEEAQGQEDREHDGRPPNEAAPPEAPLKPVRRPGLVLGPPRWPATWTPVRIHSSRNLYPTPYTVRM